MPSIVRSIIAIVAGYASMAAVVVALTVLVKRKAPEWMGTVGKPNPTYIYANLFYSFGAAMIGGFVAALVAPRAPLAHACALAGIVFVLAVVSALQMANKQPRWYQIALAVIGPLGTIFGGMVQALG
ncbi:MAG: hypothetical protein M3Y05_06270 [Gemmatimonadota bacterium]|nr:hypothetical protein [Gemmatimonadota bacterium]